jgi:hypothetical protein
MSGWVNPAVYVCSRIAEARHDGLTPGSSEVNIEWELMPGWHNREKRVLPRLGGKQKKGQSMML